MEMYYFDENFFEYLIFCNSNNNKEYDSLNCDAFFASKLSGEKVEEKNKNWARTIMDSCFENLNLHRQLTDHGQIPTRVEKLAFASLSYAYFSFKMFQKGMKEKIEKSFSESTALATKGIYHAL